MLSLFLSFFFKFYYLFRLRLFRHFNPFRVLVCSGDGSVGWVLSEIDRLNMQVTYYLFLTNNYLYNDKSVCISGAVSRWCTTFGYW